MVIYHDIEIDKEALQIVSDYVYEHTEKSNVIGKVYLYIVWKCKTLQNWKYLISTTLTDNMYYEVTFNGNSREWYLDAYKKLENVVIEEA